MDSNLDSKILIWWISMWFNGMLVHSCFVLADFIQEILRHLRSIVFIPLFWVFYVSCIGIYASHRCRISSINGMTVIHECPHGIFLNPYHPVHQYWRVSYHRHGRIIWKLSRKQRHSNGMMLCISISSKPCSTWCWHLAFEHIIVSPSQLTLGNLDSQLDQSSKPRITRRSLCWWSTTVAFLGLE